MQKKPLYPITGGLILFLVMAVITLVLNLGNLQGNVILRWFSYLLVIGGIAIFVIKYAKDMNGNITFGNLFAYGFKTTSVLVVFFIAFMIIFYMVFPVYKAQMLELGNQKALENAKGANKEDMAKGMEIYRRFFWVLLIAGIMISYAIMGVIGGLLGAAIAKKNPNPVSHEIN